MIFESGLGIDTDVVDKVQSILLQQIFERNIHNSLMSSRDIAKSKRYYLKLIDSILDNKDCFFIFYINFNLLIIRDDIESNKVFSFIKGIKDLINEEDYVSI